MWLTGIFHDKCRLKRNPCSPISLFSLVNQISIGPNKGFKAVLLFSTQSTVLTKMATTLVCCFIVVTFFKYFRIKQLEGFEHLQPVLICTLHMPSELQNRIAKNFLRGKCRLRRTIEKRGNTRLRYPFCAFLFNTKKV